MENSQKLKIKTALAGYIKKYRSQNEAAKSLTAISSATLSQIMNDNWELISEDMWRKVAAQIGFSEKNWHIANTSVFVKLTSFFTEAQNNPKGIDAFVVNSSMGKSVAVDAFCAENMNAYYIRCHRFMSVRTLFKELLKAMGKDSSGTTMDNLNSLVSYLERETKPLLIIDEVDKLKDEVLEMFVDLENKLHHKCGIVFLATPYLKKRIEQGVGRNKRGFSELYSRMKRVFWELSPNKRELVKDVKVICEANGITDTEAIESMTVKCEADFRVLTDMIIAYNNQQKVA